LANLHPTENQILLDRVRKPFQNREWYTLYIWLRFIVHVLEHQLNDLASLFQLDHRTLFLGRGKRGRRKPFTKLVQIIDVCSKLYTVTGFQDNVDLQRAIRTFWDIMNVSASSVRTIERYNLLLPA
ncbi:hypothetical protein C0991_009481, partial [Blastosporella zonata]